MAPLNADRVITARHKGHTFRFLMAANGKIYKGSLVCANSTGYITPAADTAGLKFLGVAAEQVDNTGGAAGAKSIKIYRMGIFQFDALAITQAMVGNAQYLMDDHTIASSAPPSNDIRVGILQEYNEFLQTPVVGETLGTGNGANRDFYLDFVSAKSVQATYLNAVLQGDVWDLVVNNAIQYIRFDVAPGAGVVVTADYTYSLDKGWVQINF